MNFGMESELTEGIISIASMLNKMEKVHCILEEEMMVKS